MSPVTSTPVVNDRRYTYTHKQNRNSDCTAVSEGHTNTDMVKTISYIDDIKDLHTNCRVASCFVSYAHERLGLYHGIAWFMPLVLLLLCAVNPLLTDGFPYKWSIVRNFVVWLMFEWAVEQTVDIQVRKPIKPILCYCYVIRHSVIDDITGS